MSVGGVVQLVVQHVRVVEFDHYIDGHLAERAGEPAGRIVFLVQKVSVLNVLGRHTGMQARLKM